MQWQPEKYRPVLKLMARRLYLDRRFRDDPLIAEHIPEVRESLQPVGNLLPPELACTGGAGPGVALEFAVLAELGKTAGESIRFKHKLFAQPALGLDGSDWKFRQRARREAGR